MKSGELRFPFTLRLPTITEDDFNHQEITYADSVTIWCNIEMVDQVEGTSDNQDYSEVTHKLTSRYDSRITSDCQLVYNSQTYDIVKLLNEGNRNRELTIYCKVNI